MPDISIIIRTRDEERWIGHCLKMVFRQRDADFEVILVDNRSTDHTLAIARRHPLASIVELDDYRPGLALNQGIRASSGRFIACLSAHCLPSSEHWLATLRRNLDQDHSVAGTYGRQLPVRFTSAVDKRDLITVFGQDRRIQLKDYFFHNANSMLRRDVWERFPFDESVTNVEDRVWGKAVIEAGYRLVYDPDAAVYHHHGLHQGNAPERARGVVSVIEQVEAAALNDLPESLRPEHTDVAAVVPVRAEIEPDTLEDRLLGRAIGHLGDARYVRSIHLLAGDEALAERHGARWIDREAVPGADNMSLDELMKASLLALEAGGHHPDALLYVNYDYAFRPPGFFDDLVVDAQYEGYDTVFAGLADFGHYWFRNGSGEFAQTDPSLSSRDQREPLHKALYGLGCLTAAHVVRTGRLVGGRIGILPLSDPALALRLKDIGPDSVFRALLERQAVDEVEHA